MYLRFVELCRSAACGVDAGLAPADREELYSRFYQKAGRSIDQRTDRLIEILLKQWRVDSLEQLQSVLQVIMNRKFLTQAVTSQDTMQSPGGHLAVIAALEAEGYARSKPSAIRLKRENNFRQFLSEECRATLEELSCNELRLLKSIERVCDIQGLPAQMGIMLIDETQVETTRLFRVDQYRGARLLVALDEIDFNAEGIVAPSNPKSLEFSFSFLRNAMNWHRVRNDHRASLRTLLLHKQDDLDSSQEAVLRSVIWSGKYDHTWLIEIYRGDDPLSEKARTMCRRYIVDAIKQGCRMAFSVRRSIPIAFELCRLCDAEWLNSTIPPRTYKGLSFADKRARCRRKIMVAIEAGITHRANLPKRVKRWCFENDREWLERTVLTRAAGRLPKKR